MLGQSTRIEHDVWASGPRFRIVSREDGSEKSLIYDGKRFARKSGPDGSPDIGRRTELEVQGFRFWRQELSGDPMPGGRIAGRDTLLYQGQRNGADGQMTSQIWVDAETGVVLKKSFTIYAAQLEQVISKTTQECVEIRYGSVDDAMFVPT